MKQRDKMTPSASMAPRRIHADAAPSERLAVQRTRIRIRQGLVGCGVEFTAALDADGRIHYTGGNRWGQEEATTWEDVIDLFCGSEYILGLTRSGEVRFAGRDTATGAIRRGASSLICVRALSCGPRHAAALMGNGRVKCMGDDPDGRTDTAAWKNMVAVCCGATFTLGLTKNGRVLAVGNTGTWGHKVAAWRNVTGLFTDVHGRRVYAIVDGGRLLSTAPVPIAAQAWSDLVQVTAVDDGLWGVTSKGKLLFLDRELPATLLAREEMVNQTVAFAAGPAHAVLLDTEGRLCGWGEALHRGRPLRTIPWGSEKLGRCTVTVWDPMFHHFEDLCDMRRRQMRALDRDERQYQRSLACAVRYGRRMACGFRLTACIAADGRVQVTGGAYMHGVREWKNIVALACGSSHLLALCEDGRVVAAGNNSAGCCDVSSWSHVTRILAGRYHSMALTEEGRVLLAGRCGAGQAGVTEWKDIKMLRGTETCTIGVDKNGNFHVAGRLPVHKECLLWFGGRCPVDLCLTGHLIAALYADGHVVAVGDESCCDGQTRQMLEDAHTTVHMHLLNTSEWHDIRALAAGGRFLVGLCYGGHVVAVGNNGYGQCNVQSWRRVVSLACGETHTLGLCADGTVVSAGKQRMTGDMRSSAGTGGGGVVGYEKRSASDDVGRATAWEAVSVSGYAPCDTSTWRDVLAVACGRDHAVAMTRGGRVLACGRDDDGQCGDTLSFVLFRDLKQYDGHGRYSMRPETASRVTEDLYAEERRTTADGDGLLFRAVGWETYAPALRADAEAYARWITGDDTQLIFTDAYGEDPLHGEAYAWTWGQKDGSVRLLREPFDAYLSASPATGGGHAAGSAELVGEFVATSTSGTHTVGLRADGTVAASGCRESGECDVDGWDRIIRAVAVPGATIGLRADGTLLTTGKWGHVLSALRGVRSLTYIGAHLVMVMADGRLLTHRPGSEYLPEEVREARLFHPVPGRSVLSRWEAPATVGKVCGGMDTPAGARQLRLSFGCGLSHLARLLPDGRVGTFGANDCGQRETLSWSGASAVACGWNHTAAVVDGRIQATGWNLAGQSRGEALNLHLVRAESAMSGQSLPGNGFFISVACGYEHTVALRGDGRVFATGADPDGRCDTEKWQRVVSVACGVRHTVALTEDGRCLAVGDNRQGQCRVETWENVVMVACGEYHTVGLRADGRLLFAGSDRRGQGRLQDLTDVISICCLPEATVCVHADGHVTVRGGEEMLAEAASRLSDVVAVDGREHRLCALTVDRRLVVLPPIG